MSFIFDYLPAIRDILWTILTYRKAKLTIFQPLRTEVVKRQTELLVEILDFLSDDGTHFYFKVDYMGIISCNAYLLLKHYGFVLSDESVGKAVEENLSGMLILKESGVLKSFRLPNVFDDKDDDFNNDLDKEDYELAKQGIVELEVLHLTKCHDECMKRIDYFINNPFTPSSIQEALKKIVQNILYNLKYPLKQELINFVIELCKRRGATSDNPIRIEHNAIYNNFQRISRDNKLLIEEIRKITRKYLMIDYKWK